MGAIKSAVGGAAKAVGGAVGGAVKAVGSALKPKPMVRKPGQTSVRTRGGGAPQVAKPKPQVAKPTPQATPVQTKQPAPQASPAPQAKPAAPAPKMGRTEVANRQKLGDARVDALKAKNQEFQAAKKSGNLAQFRKDNPKMSGRERAQAMAKARIAAKNAPAAKPTANTVTKPDPQQAQAKQAAPAPQSQQKAAATPSGDKLKAGSFGISAKGKEQATANRAEVAKKNTVPSGSFGISAKGKEQASANKKEVAVNKKEVPVKNNQSGGVKTVNVGGKNVDLSKVGPGMRQKLLQKNVGKNAADEVNKVNPKPGQTVNVKQDPKTGSVSSSVTTKKTIGVDPSPGKSDTKSLVNPNKKQNVKNAKNLKKDFMKVDKDVSSMSIDKEPKAQVTVGKFDDF